MALDPDVQRTATGNVHVEDPLREVTRKERRALLGVSIAAILITKMGLVPSEVQNFGIKFTTTQQSALLLVLAAVVGYFLFVFILYAITDWLAVMWALHTANVELQHETRLVELRRQNTDPDGGVAATVPEFVAPPFKFRRLASVAGYLRKVVDFAMPVTIGAYALMSIFVAISQGAWGGGGMMTGPKWLIVSGGATLLVGLVMAFVAARFGNRVMGRAGLGVAVLAPDEDSTEWLAKEGRRRAADLCFYAGLILTAIGVVLQTIGGAL